MGTSIPHVNCVVDVLVAAVLFAAFSGRTLKHTDGRNEMATPQTEQALYEITDR